MKFARENYKIKTTTIMPSFSKKKNPPQHQFATKTTGLAFFFKKH
jgi:hypothetical protein